MAGQAVVLYDFNGDEITSINPLPVALSGGSADVQYPLATDGDSVYAKDIWVEESVTIGWTDEDSTGLDLALIPFTNLHTRLHNETADNPKTVTFHFNRTVSLDQVGLGSIGTDESFSNVKIIVLGSGAVERTVLDESASNTKYTSRNYQFGPELGNAVKLEFHTADAVCISNCTIQKVTKTATRLQALKPDGATTDIDATAGGNLKVSLEEFESDVSTNSNSQLRTTLYGEDGQDLYIEQLTGGMPNINTDHALIHQGYGYSFSILLNPLSDSTIKEYCLTAPSSRYIHLKNFNIQVLGSSISAEIIINPVVTINTGTAVAINNLNHNSALTAEATIKEDPTYTGGTSARAIYALSDSTNQVTGNADFNSNPNQEFVTKSNNEEYIFKITNLTSNDCVVSVDAFFYEETQGLVT